MGRFWEPFWRTYPTSKAVSVHLRFLKDVPSEMLTFGSLGLLFGSPKRALRLFLCDVCVPLCKGTAFWRPSDAKVSFLGSPRAPPRVLPLTIFRDLEAFLDHWAFCCPHLLVATLLLGDLWVISL